MTRFYFPNSGNSDINSPFSTRWFDTSDADVLKATTTQTYGSLTDKYFEEPVNAIFNYSMLNRQYISAPLSGDIVFSGTIHGQLSCWQSNSSGNFKPMMLVKLTNNTGISKGSLYSFTSSTGDMNNYSINSGQNRYFPATGALSNLTGISGDRIVFELGTVSYNVNNPMLSGFQRFGISASGNLPVNETSVEMLSPWMEFSQNFVMME